MPYMHARSLLALSLSMVISATAQASPEDPAVLDKIEVKGFPFRYQASDPSSAMKTETALKDTPQAVTVVTEQQIDDQALHGMAGISSRTASAMMSNISGTSTTSVRWRY
jgi:catecholate siderophore receptor